MVFTVSKGMKGRFPRNHFSFRFRFSPSGKRFPRHNWFSRDPPLVLKKDSCGRKLPSALAPPEGGGFIIFRICVRIVEKCKAFSSSRGRGMAHRTARFWRTPFMAPRRSDLFRKWKIRFSPFSEKLKFVSHFSRSPRLRRREVRARENLHFPGAAGTLSPGTGSESDKCRDFSPFPNLAIGPPRGGRGGGGRRGTGDGHLYSLHQRKSIN